MFFYDYYVIIHLSDIFHYKWNPDILNSPRCFYAMNIIKTRISILDHISPNG